MSIQAFPMISHARALPWGAKRNLLTIREIQSVVCAYYNLDPRCMVSNRRERSVARPRQVAMYLARELTPKSMPDIGNRFGGRDHTTVLHAVRTIARLVEIDAEFQIDVLALRARLAA